MNLGVTRVNKLTILIANAILKLPHDIPIRFKNYISTIFYSLAKIARKVYNGTCTLDLRQSKKKKKTKMMGE